MNMNMNIKINSWESSSSRHSKLHPRHCCRRPVATTTTTPTTTTMLLPARVTHHRRPTTRPPRHATTAASLPNGSQGQESFSDVMNNIVAALASLQQAPSPPSTPPGCGVMVSNLSYHPPGSPEPLLRNVSLHLPPNTLGIIFGRSGSGKSTLLQVISGLVDQTEGTIAFSGSSNQASGDAGVVTAQERMNKSGLVFQFPERHFIGNTLAEELTAGWPAPDTAPGMLARQSLAARAAQVLAAVGLDTLPVTTRLAALSDGYKRRVALAVQLVRQPSLLLLDEPLAGLDWKTREELVKLLGALKKECTVLVVSHDLRELGGLVAGGEGRSWRMHRGGVLMEEKLPTSV